MRLSTIAFAALAAVAVVPAGSIKPANALEDRACPPGGYVIFEHGHWRMRCAHIKQDPTRSAKGRRSVPVPGGGAQPARNKIVRDHSQPIVRDHRMAGGQRGPVHNRK